MSNPRVAMLAGFVSRRSLRLSLPSRIWREAPIAQRYGQLSREERVRPETLAAEVHPGQATAVHLGRSQATISPELRRNR